MTDVGEQSRGLSVEPVPSQATIAALTHPGLVRESNEDCIGVGGWIRNSPARDLIELVLPLASDFLVLLADGIGGQASGSLASQIGVSRISARILATPLVSEGFVAQVLSDANRELWELFGGTAQHRGAGTTVAGLAYSEGHLIAFNIGDTRIYRRQDKFLELLSQDDRASTEELADLVGSSVSTKTLLQALGGTTQLTALQPHIRSVPIAVGDEFLLCTDGLTDAVSLDHIEAALSQRPSETVIRLRDLTFSAGAPDNVSIAVVKIA